MLYVCRDMFYITFSVYEIFSREKYSVQFDLDDPFVSRNFSKKKKKYCYKKKKCLIVTGTNHFII